MSEIRTTVRGTMNEATGCGNTRPPLTRSTSTSPKEGLAMKATLKPCRTCGELRPTDNFYTYNVEGKRYEALACKRCQRAAVKAKAAAVVARRGGSRKRPGRVTQGGMSGKERYAYWTTYKRDRGCADCGTSDHQMLQFDHLPQHEKLFTIAEAIPRTGIYSDDQIAAEAAKCEVVCGPCHRIRTTSRLRYPRVHDPRRQETP